MEEMLLIYAAMLEEIERNEAKLRYECEVEKKKYVSDVKKTQVIQRKKNMAMEHTQSYRSQPKMKCMARQGRR